MKKNVLILLIIGIISVKSTCSKEDDILAMDHTPGTPNKLVATAISATAVQITWDQYYINGGPSTSRILARKGPNDVNFKNISDNLDPSVTQFKDSIGLVGGTEYTYRLIAFYNAVQSKPKDATVTTLSAAASLPNVTIGSQIWALQNLDVATYRNGEPIPQVTTKARWIATRTGAWCYFNFDSTYGPIYGKIYNRFAVDDARGLAPLGWRIPTSTDWYTLRASQGGKAVAGDKLKSTTSRWTASSYSTPSNTSGFTGLPSGYVTPESLNPLDGSQGSFWTSTDSTYNTNIQGRIFFFLYNGTSELYNSVDSANMGYSVRVIKN
jgi:uncharacterized protein (TIGR02145 family)